MVDRLNLKTVYLDVHANSHKQIFNHFARALSPAVFYDYHKLTDDLSHLSGNETAAIGGGVMVFHGWLDDWEDSTLSFARLRKPYEALNTPDNEPIDLVLLLLSPRVDGPMHLSRLSKLTRMMRDQSFCDMLRGANSTDAIEALFDRMERIKKAA